MIPLDGCRREPLGSYLQALGGWKAVTRLIDPDVRASWVSGRLVLDLDLDVEQLVAILAARFVPLPIVSPWNAGSGFAGNGKSVEAERTLATVRTAEDPRLDRLRAAVLVADRVVAQGRTAGWGGSSGELWDKTYKVEVIRLCRNLLPDDALPWLDAVVAVGQDHRGESEMTYSRLLGTGGNFGRLDLQATYVQRALTVLGKDSWTESTRWLHAALFGDESTPYLRDTVGQFDPGRAGGIHSSPREKADEKGFANPWSFLLTVEGALLFASATTRRQGALNAEAALPFMVRGSGVGFGSTAVDEGVLGEIWTPEWDRPASLPEVERLLGEGRADWNGHPATTGLDFVRAVSSLGVDRGVRRFTRSVFVERHGQNPLAVPVGVVEVTQRSQGGLLARLDPWLSRLRRTELPAGVVSWLRQVDEALYEVARGGEPGTIRVLLGALGGLHEAVSRSGAVRERVPPLTLGRAGEWWAAVQTGDREQRVAAALASGSDHASRPALRSLLTPVRVDGRPGWSGSPPPVETGTGITLALAAAHRRRALPGMVPDPLRDPGRGSDELGAEPAVHGVFSAFRRGLQVPLDDVVAFATADGFDDEQLRDDLRGLLLLDWSGDQMPPSAGVRGRIGTPSLPPLLALLLPFYASGPLRVRLRDDDPADTALVLRPGAAWLPWLHAGGAERVARDAVTRLRAAGVQGLIDPDHAAVGTDGDRLAAALLPRVSPADRVVALGGVAVLPRPRAA